MAATIERKNSIGRSISFDVEIFEKMEARRESLRMERSEYIKRCILKDMAAGGDMTLPILPESLAAKPDNHGKAKRKR